MQYSPSQGHGTEGGGFSDDRDVNLPFMIWPICVVIQIEAIQTVVIHAWWKSLISYLFTSVPCMDFGLCWEFTVSSLRLFIAEQDLNLSFSLSLSDPMSRGWLFSYQSNSNKPLGTRPAILNEALWLTHDCLWDCDGVHCKKCIGSKLNSKPTQLCYVFQVRLDCSWRAGMVWK